MPSKSASQARLMAAAAHDPAFAKKVGIKPEVAKHFNDADAGSKLLSKAMKGKPKAKTEAAPAAEDVPPSAAW